MRNTKIFFCGALSYRSEELNLTPLIALTYWAHLCLFVRECAPEAHNYFISLYLSTARTNWRFALSFSVVHLSLAAENAICFEIVQIKLVNILQGKHFCQTRVGVDNGK